MDLQFRTTRLVKLCNERREGVKKWGARRVKVLGRRLDDLSAAVTLEDMRYMPGDCHEYRHQEGHTFTLDLDGGWRLFFQPRHDPAPLLPDGESLDWAKVTEVEITDVRDPHE